MYLISKLCIYIQKYDYYSFVLMRILVVLEDFVKILDSQPRKYKAL